MPTHLFTYGTLMFPEVWQAVVGRDFAHSPAHLAGYQIFRVRDALYPGIIAEPSGTVPTGDRPKFQDEIGTVPLASGPPPSALRSPPFTVPGLLYLDVDPAAIARLDRFEGDEYRRITVEVTTTDGRHLEAQAYVVPDESRHLLTDEIWTAEQFEARGHLAEFAARYSGFGRLA